MQHLFVDNALELYTVAIHLCHWKKNCTQQQLVMFNVFSHTCPNDACVTTKIIV